MTSIIKSRAERGFTLIEVLVALGVAGGALVLILSANNASLRRSVQSRLEERLRRAAESKLSEWRLGAERAAEGPLAGFPGHTWEVRTSREDLGDLEKLIRVRFSVRGPGGSLFEWTTLLESPGSGP